MCARCKQEPHDGWPDGRGGQLCQMCWEAQCSDSWWRMMDACYQIRDATKESNPK